MYMLKVINTSKNRLMIPISSISSIKEYSDIETIIHTIDKNTHYVLGSYDFITEAIQKALNPTSSDLFKDFFNSLDKKGV